MFDASIAIASSARTSGVLSNSRLVHEQGWEPTNYLRDRFGFLTSTILFVCLFGTRASMEERWQVSDVLEEPINWATMAPMPVSDERNQPTPAKTRSRRQHKKSRNGCHYCKRRRIKVGSSQMLPTDIYAHPFFKPVRRGQTFLWKLRTILTAL